MLIGDIILGGKLSVKERLIGSAEALKSTYETKTIFVYREYKYFIQRRAYSSTA